MANVGTAALFLWVYEERSLRSCQRIWWKLGCEGRENSVTTW